MPEMLTLGIRYLNGFVAASHGSHDRVEWPPHPARVFMALVAAHYQTGAEPAEREALLWLEALADPPEIYAGEAFSRAVVTHFVPVNDKAGPAKAIMNSLPITRDRQPRTFARAWLSDDTVFLRWPRAELSQTIRNALAAICDKVTRIGHSSSLVQMWLADEVPAELSPWVPDMERGSHSLRITAEGTLSDLDRDFGGENIARYEELLFVLVNAASAKDRSAARRALNERFPGGPPTPREPSLSVYRGYARRDEILDVPPISETVFSSHLLVFSLEREDGSYRFLDLACTLSLTDRWRDALVSHANDLSTDARSVLSGHAANGRVLDQPHAAFLPLGFVSHPNADGRLSGAALALPINVNGGLRTELLRAVGRVSNLVLGRLGKWKLVPVTMARPPLTLRADTWTCYPHGAHQWSSITPVAFDQHPKAKDKATYLEEAAAMISACCERIGLPRPRQVFVTPVSAHIGAPPAHAFPRLRRKDGSERRHSHAILVFNELVRGPILIGAGRYRGYGLFRPVEVTI